MEVCIEPYSPRYKDVWDELVRKSTNGTFLFERNYMEYHSDRFEDASLLAFDERKRLLALLPANRKGDTLISHEGLSYGGFVSDKSATIPKIIKVFNATIAYLVQSGLRCLVYKSIPHIYHRFPAEEASYALMWFAARLV